MTDSLGSHLLEMLSNFCRKNYRKLRNFVFFSNFYIKNISLLPFLRCDGISTMTLELLSFWVKNYVVAQKDLVTPQRYLIPGMKHSRVTLAIQYHNLKWINMKKGTKKVMKPPMTEQVFFEQWRANNYSSNRLSIFRNEKEMNFHKNVDFLSKFHDNVNKLEKK